MWTRKCIILLALILFSQLVGGSSTPLRELIFVKVVFSNSQINTIEYFQVLDNKISFSIKTSTVKNVTIIIDPRSGIRPTTVKVNGETVPPGSPSLHYGLYDLNIDTESIGTGTYEVFFEEYNRLPIVFVLFIPENFTKIDVKEKIYANIEKWKTFGYFVYVLTLEEGVVTINTSKPFSLLLEKEVEYMTPLGPSKGKELIYYVQDSEFTVEGDVISLAYKPILLFYENVFVSNSKTIRVFDIPATGLNGTYFLLLYKPEYVESLSVSEGERVASLPFNLSIGEHAAYIINKAHLVSIEYKVREVEVLLKGKEAGLPVLNVEIESDGRIYTIENVRNVIHIAPPLKLPIKMSLYYNGFKVGEYLLYTLYDRLTLDVFLSRVKAYVTDISGKELKQGKLLLYSLSEAIENEFTIQDGEADLGFLPEGEYLARVIVDGVEVSRMLFNPTQVADLNLVCRVSDVEITIKDLDFNPIKNLTVILKEVSKYSQVTDSNGVARFEQVPLSTYEIRVLSNNTLLYMKNIDLSVKNKFNIILELRSLKIKVVNILGNPIRGAQITLVSEDGKIEKTGRTGEDGKFCFSLLPLNTYRITCKVGNYEKSLKFTLTDYGNNFMIIKTDIYFTLFGFAFDTKTVLLVCVAIFIILIFIKKSREKGEIEIV